MAMMRESAFIPTIKCSSCGNEVEISQMGEHICSGAGNEALPPMPEHATQIQQRFQNQFAGSQPALNASAANHAFQGQDSFAGDHANQPHTPNPLLRRPGGYGGFGNDDEVDDSSPEPSKTGDWHGAPMMHDGGPSLASQNPYPYPRRKESFDGTWRGGHERTKTAHSYTSSVASIMTSRQTKLNGYGGFDVSEPLPEHPVPPLPRTDGYGGFQPPPPPAREEEERSASPARLGGYGGFDTPSSPPLSEGANESTISGRMGGYGGFEAPLPPLLEERVASPARMNGYGGFDAQPTPPSPPPLRQERAPSPGSESGYSDLPTPPPRSQHRVATPVKSTGYGGFDDPTPRQQQEEMVSPAPPSGQSRFDAARQRPESSREALNPPPHAPLARSETFPPPPNHAQDAAAAAAAALPAPPLRGATLPGPYPERQRQNSAFDDGRQGTIGPDLTRVPPPRANPIRPSTSGNVDLAAEFGASNPYHTPSESGSSGRSTFSYEHSYTSSQTSPARSHVPLPRKSPASTGMSDMMNEVQASMNDLHVNIDSRGPLRTPSPLAESQPEMMPPPGPLDIAPPRPIVPPTQIRRQNSGDPGYGDLANSPTRMAGSPQSPQSPAPLRKVLTDPTKSKGDCKGCRLPITGKCISSKDGRLTGRYHKACFVCATCAQPFTSAEFYVLSDLPYCERDYHHLNGSLCGGCGNGIEGEYLEDEAFVKYHTGCFRCLDCGFVLAEGYFEVEGRAYCERDALARLQAQQIAYSHSHPPAPHGQGFRGGPPRPGRGGRPPPGMRPPPRSSSSSSGGRPMPGPGPGPGPRMGPSMSRGGPPGRGQPRGPPPSAGLPRMNKRMTRMGNM